MWFFERVLGWFGSWQVGSGRADRCLFGGWLAGLETGCLLLLSGRLGMAFLLIAYLPTNGSLVHWDGVGRSG